MISILFVVFILFVVIHHLLLDHNVLRLKKCQCNLNNWNGKFRLKLQSDPITDGMHIQLEYYRMHDRLCMYTHFQNILSLPFSRSLLLSFALSHHFLPFFYNLSFETKQTKALHQTYYLMKYIFCVVLSRHEVRPFLSNFSHNRAIRITIHIFKYVWTVNSERLYNVQYIRI